jgi:Transposase DDE domain
LADDNKQLFQQQGKKKLETFFDKNLVTRMGYSSGFVQRKPQKISAIGFVIGFLESCSKGSFTYQQWATEIGNWSGKLVSKQALYDRINSSTSVDFAKSLFTQAMGKKMAAVTDGSLFSTFKRVLLQDSTTLSLPGNLKDQYPGNMSGGKQKALARLQCLINIKTMQWLEVDLHPFTRNDQSASKLVLPMLKKGDLLIRDLGYFVTSVFEQIQQQQAFYISRLRYGMTMYDENGKLINWKQLCNSKGAVDRIIRIGLNHKLSLRIVMIPLPEAMFAEKIRKAKADRDKRLNHSEDYYLWLRYNVFITNVPPTTLDTMQVSEAYKVRWQIEILFKSWKSCLHLQKMLHERCTNIYRAQTSIYLTLMFFTIIVSKVYMLYEKKVFKLCGKYLSLIKVCAYLSTNLLSLILKTGTKLQITLATKCCYESRNDRQNMTHLIRKPFTLT